MREFVIIADDFTGANDTGVQIKRHGMPIDVILDANALGTDEANIVIDTESRVIPVAEASQRVENAVRQVLDKGGCHHLYKKVDSTLRGNIAAEIKAILAVYQPELVIFTPALPGQGRTTVAGRLCVNGTPLLQTEIAKDPRNPVKEDNITKLLADCTTEPIHHMVAGDLVNGTGTLSDHGYYTFDVTTVDELSVIASKVVALQKKTLWIGSAGLAEGLLNCTHPMPPVFAVVGSVSSKSMEQMAYCQSQGISIVSLDMMKLYESKQIGDTIQPVLDSLCAGKDTILTAAPTREYYEKFLAFGEAHGAQGNDLAEFTKQLFSVIVPAVLAKVKISGLFLTGGDTAIAVSQKLGAVGSHIEQQLLPGIVQGRFSGGQFDDLPVVTKAGAFGTAEDLFKSINKMKEITK